MPDRELTLPPEPWVAMGGFRAGQRGSCAALEDCAATGYRAAQRVMPTSELGPQGEAAEGDRLHFSDSAEGARWGAHGLGVQGPLSPASWQADLGLEQPAPVCAPLLAPVAAALLGTVFAKHPYLLMKASSISCLGKP